MADRRDHLRPGRGDPRARRAGQDAVLARRRARPAAGAGQGRGGVHPHHRRRVASGSRVPPDAARCRSGASWRHGPARRHRVEVITPSCSREPEPDGDPWARTTGPPVFAWGRRHGRRATRHRAAADGEDGRQAAGDATGGCTCPRVFESGRADRSAGRSAAARELPRSFGCRQRAAVLGCAAGGDRRGARRPHDRGGALPRRDRRLAHLHPHPVRRPGARAVGDRAAGQARRASSRQRGCQRHGRRRAAVERRRDRAAAARCLVARRPWRRRRRGR